MSELKPIALLRAIEHLAIGLAKNDKKHTIGRKDYLLANMSDDVIWIVTDELPQVVVPDGSRDGVRLPNPFDEPAEIIRSDYRRGVPVKVEKLEQGMADFLQVMGRSPNINDIVQHSESNIRSMVESE